MRGLRNLLALVQPRRFRKASPLSIAEALRHTSFDQILTRRLQEGSHEFPGLDGGTSVNEAAVVVAGLQYRAVADIRDLPECFCPVIGAYTLVLNEMMPDSPRQRLLPYATSLAGTADEFAVKIRRGEYLALAAARMFTARALRWTD